MIKELLHNAVKYSGASVIEIEVEKGDLFTISLTEIEGIGFDFESMKNKGNGLYNIEKRMKGIGDMQFKKSGQGMQIKISIELSKRNEI